MLASTLSKRKSFAFYTFLSCLLAFSFSFESCTKDPCEAISCLNGGTCANGACNCPVGYSGSNCATYNPCASITCLNGGTCVSGTCNCPPGYSGTYCQNYDPCAIVTCLNGGTCVSGTCNCLPGYTGPNCATVLNPVSMTITNVYVTNYPTLNTSGGGWDLSTGADLFLALSLGTSSNSTDWITGYTNDVTGNALYYTLTTPKVITNLSSYWTIGCWDYDTPDPDDFMGGIYFAPNSYKSGFPASFVISNASFSFTFYVTWQF